MNPSQLTDSAGVTATPDGGVQQAIVVRVDSGGVRVDLAEGNLVDATLAVVGGDSLREGDRVLACGDSAGAWFVIGIIDADAIQTRSGANARITQTPVGEQIEVRDSQQRVIFRYNAESGGGTLTMPKGDFAIQAPCGDISLLAGKAVKIQSPSLQLQARRGEFKITDGVFTGRNLQSTVKHLRLNCEQMHTVVGRLVERAKDVYRHVAGLQQLTAGRVRELVKGSWVLRSGRANMKAVKDVRIDGEKINLG